MIRLLRTLTGGCLLLLALAAGADALSDLPEPWGQRLAPVPEADLSGAERLMQEAVGEARTATDALLLDPAAAPADVADAYGRLGALLLMLEVEALADRCFRNAHALAPADFRWPYYAGYLAMMAGNTDQALAYLTAAREIDPHYPALALRLGRVHLERNELEAARAALAPIADAPGLVTAANYYLGQVALLERRFEDALAHLTRALEADPDAREVHYPLAQACRALGRDALAREHLARFEVRTPQAADPLLDALHGAAKRSLPAFQKGIHAIRGGDYAAAADWFAQGLAVDPVNAHARVSHARALYLAGRGDAAAAELARALEEAPDHTLARFLDGVLRQQQGDRAGARTAWQQVLSLEPGHTGAVFYLANLDFADSRYGEAAAGYARALAADREIPPARLLAPVARFRAGGAEADALGEMEAASGASPDDPMLRHALVRLLAAAEDPALRDPARALEQARYLALAQPIPPHQRALALALAASGDFDGAVATQQQAALFAWTAGPQERALMEQELAAFQERRLPPAWPEGDPLLAPPPFDPVAPFRDYPAAVPY